MTTTPAPVEAIEAVGYENADGALYGYANHKAFTGNPCSIPVRIIREGDYQAMVNALTASERYAAQVRTVVEAHCADLAKCATTFREQGMTQTADQTCLAIYELRELLDKEPK